MKSRRVMKIISGGQAGVDRAALDVAIVSGIPCGGWCPMARYAEDGRIGDRYPLTETPSGNTAQRTEWNVRDSDGTLVLTRGEPSGGTALTIRFAIALGKPFLIVDLAEPGEAGRVRQWIGESRIEVLNVAGPRESKCPGIHRDAFAFLRTVLFAQGGSDSENEFQGRTHTFLFKQGLWILDGEYYDRYRNAYSAAGQSETIHRKEIWIEDRIVKVFFEEPMAIATRYEIEPFEPGKTFTNWKAGNRILGNLKGDLFIMGDTIRSQFRSEDGRYSGCERLQMVDDGIYRSRRVLLDGDRMRSSWVMEFRRMDDR